MRKVRSAGLRTAAWVLAGVLGAAAAARHVEFVRYVEVQPILEALRELAPPDLKGGVDDAASAAAWDAWAKKRNADIRARLAQGDADTLVNLMLFGTSFTTQPRVTLEELFQLATLGSGASAALQTKGATLRARAADLAAALAAPGPNERLQFARRLLEQHRASLPTPVGTTEVVRFLLDNLHRVLREQASYQHALLAAKQLGDVSAEFAERSKLYKDRGLSLDTSLKPDFALQQALAEMKNRRLFPAAGVRRVAIVGPGLDFTDKDAGYDFYPPQTVQPFAVIDTLVRLGLGKADAIELVTLDISPRVNDHIAGLRERARRGIGYVVNLPRDTNRKWKPELVEYWKQFGDRIGAPAPAAAAPHGSAVEMRAVRVRAGVARRIEPVDLNIVLQRLEPGERFDLVIATNVFVYYDTLEQCLALANVERMLRPGGFLLTNNALLELPFVKIKSVGYLTVVYSDREDDGDHIVWYQKNP
jgi:hypothetical protein